MNIFAISLQTIIIICISLAALVSHILLKSMRLGGILIFIAASAAFILSSLYNDLFIQILSVSFIFIFLYAAACYAAMYFVYKKIKIAVTNIDIPPIHPFEYKKLTFTAKYLPYPFPGIYQLCGFLVRKKGQPPDGFICPVTEESRNSFSIEVSFDRHGKYALSGFDFILRDVLGLTQFRIKFDFEHTVPVKPFFSRAVEIPLFLEKGGEEIIQSPVRTDSKDFYEKRKYYPGDDIRKINWKIFAHTEELHVREVEKIPPKIGKVTLVFAPYSKDPVEHEHITGIFVSTVRYLLRHDFELSILSPSSGTAAVIDKESEKKFNDIIDNSYMKFGAKRTEIKNAVIFASLEEFGEMIRQNSVKRSFAAVSYFDEGINDIMKGLRLLFEIKKSDSLISELAEFYGTSKKGRSREKKLTELKSIALDKNIEIRLFGTGE